MNIFVGRTVVWIGLSLLLGLLMGTIFPDWVNHLWSIKFVHGSYINFPITILVWLMINPTMIRLDLRSIRAVGHCLRAFVVTAAMGGLVKPLVMALLAWFFFEYLLLPMNSPEFASQYIAGLIVLAAAPGPAILSFWDQLKDGGRDYVQAQILFNALLVLVVFAPVIGLLVPRASGLHISFEVLFYLAMLFVGIPFLSASISRVILVRRKGLEWFNHKFMPLCERVGLVALVGTLGLILSYQADHIMEHGLQPLMIVISTILQFIFVLFLGYGLMKLLRVEHGMAAIGALTGASNFFEVSVATVIAVFGAESPAALAVIVWVFVEGPVVLFSRRFFVTTRERFERSQGAGPVPAMNPEIAEGPWP